MAYCEAAVARVSLPPDKVAPLLIAPAQAGPPTLSAVVLPLVHCGVGVLFSIFWRRSGLLLVPVFAHAFIDAVRNALQ